MTEQILYEIVLKGGDDVTRRIEQVSKELTSAKKAAKDLSEQLESADGENVEQLTAAYKAQTATITKLGAEYKELSREQSRQTYIAIEGLKKESGSINDKSRRLGNMKAAYRELTEEQRNSETVGKRFLKQIQDLDEEVKSLDASIGNYQRNVGNYSNLKNGLAQGVGDVLGGSGIGQIVQAGMAGGVGGAIVAGVGVTIVGALAAAESGAALELQMIKNTQVLGASLQEVEKVARQTAVALGMTENEYISNTAAVADLLKPMGFVTSEAAKMAMEVTALSAPLAAWSKDSKTASQVTDTLIAALTGEREGLKSLGIVIDEATIKQKLQEQGKDKLTGAALKQAEAEIVVAEVTRQSSDAIAAYANNSESLSRQIDESAAAWSNLKNNLLEAFLPVIKDVVGWLAKASGNLLEFINTHGTFSSVGGFWKTVGAGVLGTLGQITLAKDLLQSAKSSASAANIDPQKDWQQIANEQEDALDAQIAATKKADAIAAASDKKASTRNAAKVKEVEAEIGSVKQLSDALANMRKELERTSSGSPMFAKLKQQIEDLEAKLGIAKTMIDGQSRAQGQSVTAPINHDPLGLSGVSKEELERLANLLKQVDPAKISTEEPTYDAGIATMTPDEIEAERLKIIQKNEQDRQLEIQKTQEGLSALAAIGNAALEVNSAIQAQQLAEIEERYAREIALAKGNSQLISQLERKRDREKEQIERAAFERAKKLQIAAATIQLAAGIVNILSAPTVIPEPFGSIFKGVQIAALTATTAAQIAQIAAAEYYEGGFTSTGNSRDVAGIVHKNEYVIPQRVLSTSAGGAMAAQLEALRTGRTLQAPVYGSGNMAQEIAAGVTAAIQEIPVYVTINDIDNAQAKKTFIRQSATL